MIFGKSSAARLIGRARDLKQRPARQILRRHGRCTTRQPHGRGGHVNQADRRFTHAGLRHAGACQNHRHTGRGLIHHLLGPEPVIAHHVAVIGQIQYAGFALLPTVRQRAQNLAHAIIHETGQPVIGGLGLPHLFRIEIAVIIKKPRKVLQLGMGGPLGRIIGHRQVHFSRIIKAIEFLGRA